MTDHFDLNDSEREARLALVRAARAMLSGELSFLEGAVQVKSLMHQIRGVPDRDKDLMAFVAIESETDHLPLAAQRPYWSPEALARLEPEFRRTEEWANKFAREACRNLITRFER